MRGLISAVRTLTIIPLPGKEGQDLSAALTWFPIVGLFLGFVLYLVGRLWLLFPSNPWLGGGALLILFIQTWLTRGLHLDGLADWADSIGGFDKERRLAIMKDVSLGAFGVVALILVMMAKWLCLERLLEAGSLSWVMAIMAISRTMLVELQVILPYARKEGQGMAGPFLRNASGRHRVVSHMLTVAICLAFGPFGLGLLVFAWLMTRLYGARMRGQFGGITGDLLGAANELIETCLLVICALPGNSVASYIGWAWLG